jgi:hypothetical protein
MLLLPGTQGPGYFRTLRTLTTMLATLEHNVQGLGANSAWFEYVAENPRFPLSQRKQLDKYVKSIGESDLPRLDLYMRRRETMRRPGEPTVRVGIGFYLWEDNEQGSLERERRPASLEIKGRRRSR